MFNSKQVVQHSLFGSNGFKNTLSCEFEGLPEEVSEVINEKSQAIDSLESEREKLLQENCDLKRSIDSQKHYQEIAQEYDEEVSLLTKEKQIIERKIKDSEVKMEKLQNEIYKVQEENEELKQQVKKLDAELQIRNSQIHLLNQELKDKSMIELQEVVNEVISSGIRLNLAKDEEYYCTDEILEKIVQLGENYEIASNIVCTLISRGAKLKRSESLKVIDTIELKFKAHKANMISAHLEYVSNTEEFFRIAKAATSGQLYDGKIDNNVSYLEYSEDSIIDVARITDRTRNLELIQESYRRDIIKIGKSEVEIITENGIRYYTDLTEGSSIVLTFYTSLGNIDVRLYPDVQDKSKIIVEVSNREEILEKFKGREEELGNDCGLGEYWVYYAIEQGYFERSGKLMHSESISQSNEKTPLTKLDKIIGVSSFKETVSRCI